ncbi:MAG: hypothetical protein EZS28_056380, partial [Streblomastix strix]
QERTVEDTHTRFVAIVSMVVVVYRNRAGGAAPAELQKYIQRYEVKFVDNLNYRNNCLFDALSFISLPDEQAKRKSNCSRVAEDVSRVKQKLDLTSTYIDFKHFFDLIVDATDNGTKAEF